MATLEELESMNMEDLRDAANQNMEAEVGEQPATQEEETGEEQQAAGEGEGEQQEEEQPAAKPPALGQTVYRRVIDLGDGSGTQVFEGSTQEELIEKLANAQANATRKIRELSQTNKQTQQEQADNDYVLSQELLTKPTEAFRKMFEQVVGMPLESFKSTVDKVNAFEVKQAGRKAAEDFVTSTPAYYDVETNGKKIGRYLNANRLEFTVENMKKAYEELSADGLLVQRPQAPSAGSAEAAAQPRIAAPAQPTTPQRKAGSNLSSRGRSVTPPVKKKTSEADMYNMDLDVLREKANRELRGETVE